MRLRLSCWRKEQEGGSLVEMALICAFIYLPLLFAIFEVSFALYSYNTVASITRQATRYAAVRGSESCLIQANFADCNLGPQGGSNPSTGTGSAALLAYVQRIGGINTNNVTVTATWYEASVVNPGNGNFSTTSWPTACASNTTTTTGGVSYTYNCNQVGNAVQVKISYPFPLNIPFWKQVTIPISSTSQMVINE
jgi:Flp pilus assembly protein TadG